MYLDTDVSYIQKAFGIAIVAGLILRQFRISLFLFFIHTILFHIVEVELIKLLYTKFPDGKPTTLILLSYILRANTN